MIPSLKGWSEKYGPEGLVVIGNHYPEFPYEADLDNLKQAVAGLKVTYPVVQDNDGTNWQAFGARYWPSLYLIDKNGRIRYQHVGEGQVDETEAAIRKLLDEPAP